MYVKIDTIGILNVARIAMVSDPSEASAGNKELFIHIAGVNEPVHFVGTPATVDGVYRKIRDALDQYDSGARPLQ